MNNFSLFLFTEKGMCLLGEQCPFDHGVDPVVITGPIPPPYPPPHFPLGIPPSHNLPNTTNGLMLPSVIPQAPPPMTVATSTGITCCDPNYSSLVPTPLLLSPLPLLFFPPIFPPPATSPYPPPPLS